MFPHSAVRRVGNLTFMLVSLSCAGRSAAGQSPATVDSAWASYRAGNLAAARAEANELTTAPDDNAWARVLLGKLDGEDGRFGDAEYDRALELGGDDPNLVATVADEYAGRYADLATGDQRYLASEARRKAETLYRRWSQLEVSSALPLERLAWLHQTGGDAESAVGLLFAAIARDPASDSPHAALWAHLGTDLTYERLAAFYDGLALCDYDSLLRARCRDYQGQVMARRAEAMRLTAAESGRTGDLTGRTSALEEARDNLKQALVCASDSALIDEQYRGIAAWREAEYRVAIAEIVGSQSNLGGLDAPGQRADAPLSIAISSAVEQARQAVDGLLREQPDDASLQGLVDRLSYALFEASGGEGGSRQGMDALRELWFWATAIVADRADWWNNLGFFARESGRYEDSYAAYQRSVALAPDNVRYNNDTGLIALYHLDRDLERAEQLFQQAIALGEAQWPAAATNPEQAAQLRSALGDAMLNLGRLYRRQGRFDAALAAFDRLEQFDGQRIDLFTSRLDLALVAEDRPAVDAAIARAARMIQGAEGERMARFLRAQIRETLAETQPADAVERILAAIDAAAAAGPPGGR